MHNVVAVITLLATVTVTSSSNASTVGFGRTGIGSTQSFHHRGPPGFVPGEGFYPGAGFSPGACPRIRFASCSQARSVSGAYPDDEDQQLHFRVQEPFGPWDIGQPPDRPDR